MGTPFFVMPDGSPRESKDLNVQQIILLRWLDFYNWIFSLPDSDRPDDETIADDGLLDGWVEQYRQRKTDDIKGDKQKHHFEIGDD